MSIRPKRYHYHLGHRELTLIFIVVLVISLFVIGFYYSTSLIQPYEFIQN